MTTFQDPPPQSRRAVRQSERGEAPQEAPTSSPYTFDPNSAEGSTPSEPAVGRPTGRRAQLPSPTELAAAAEQATPSQPTPSQPSPTFEPLTYMTQARPPVPNYDVPAQPPVHQNPVQQNSVQQNPVQQSPAEDSAFRVRDFSPEGGRRAAISREQFQNVSSGAVPVLPPPSQSAPTSSNFATPTPDQVDLDYFTQGVPPTTGSHAAVPPVGNEPANDHTLTRRELRELRAAQEQPPALRLPESRLPEPIDALLNSGPIEIPILSASSGQSQALADAMAEFDALTRARREAEAKEAASQQVADVQAPVQPVSPAPIEPPVPVEPPALVEPPVPVAARELPLAELAQVDLPSTESSSPANPWTSPSAQWTALAPGWGAPAPEAQQQPGIDDPAAAEPVTQQPAVQEPVVQGPVAQGPVAQQQPVAAEPQAAAAPVFIEPEERAPSTRPVGHWSVQAEVDDEEQLPDNAIGRTVGGGSVAITTSALILPSVPQAADMTSPFSGTGEILVTGSIDLPRSLSSTGAHPHRVDNSDFEDDPLDNQVSAADSAPVRAIRAVSTHTSTRGVIESKRPQSNRMPTIMIIAASVLAVGVVGLLVAAAVLHLFS
jgi:hypothetical protein